MRVNQAGQEIEEESLFSCVGDTWTEISDRDRNDAIALILEHLKLEVWRTNANEHGNPEVQLRDAS